MRVLKVLAALSPLAFGCGLGGGTTGCDFREGSLNGPEPRCQDWIGGVVGVSYEQTCKTAGGKVCSGGCPHDGIVAGCEQKTSNADGSRMIDWYYSPKTEAQVKADCTSPDTFQPKP